MEIVAGWPGVSDRQGVESHPRRTIWPSLSTWTPKFLVSSRCGCVARAGAECLLGRQALGDTVGRFRVVRWLKAYILAHGLLYYRLHA